MINNSLFKIPVSTQNLLPIQPYLLERPSPLPPIHEEQIQYRVALDLGSGSIKMQSAWVDVINNRIVEIVDVKKVGIPLRDVIEKDPNQCIPETTFEKLKGEIEELMKLAREHGEIAGCVGTATEAYRYAVNGQEVLDRLERELGISLFRLTQDEEADLGYAALKAEGQIDEGAIIWENGGGSMQISTRTERGTQSFNLHLGKTPMKNYIIGQIQGRDIHDADTPNPISKEEAGQAIDWVKNQIRSAPSWLREKIDQTEIIGLSACFSTVIRGLGKTEFTNEELFGLLEARLDKNNEQMDRKENENPVFMLSDLLLLYGVMDELGIEKIRCAELNGPGSTSGLLVDAQKWPARPNAIICSARSAHRLAAYIRI